MKLNKISACLVISALLLTGCSSGGETQVTNTDVSIQENASSEEIVVKEPAPADITATIMSEIEIPSAVEKDIDSIDYYFTIDKTQLEDVSMYICGSGAFPDELVVLKMTSPEAAETAMTAVQEHFTSQIELYRDYTPNEFYKLEESEVIVRNNYVMLLVCSDNARAEEIAESFFIN